MAQDDGQVDTSPDFDMVTLYSSQTVDSEIEADVIRGVLESNGIPTIVSSMAACPNLGIEVKVPQARVEEAKRLIGEALAAGPEAAAEAEAASEE
jgi:hypothetical protein